MSNTKTCNKCQTEKPITEFNRNPKTKDGYYGTCKDCCAIYQRLYAEKNRDRLRQKQKEYRASVGAIPQKQAVATCAQCGKVYEKAVRNIRDKNYCSTKCVAESKRHLKKKVIYCAHCGCEVVTTVGRTNRKYCSRECLMDARYGPDRSAVEKCIVCGKDIIKIKSRQNKRFCSKECCAESMRVSDANWNNPKYIKVYLQEWQKKNQAKVKVNRSNRRARKRSRPSDFTEQDWLFCLDYWGHNCAVCGRPQGLFHVLAQDHWIPLASDDCPGTVPTNIVPLCHGEGGCNNEKKAKDPALWLVNKLGKRVAAKKLREINEYFDKVRRA